MKWLWLQKILNLNMPVIEPTDPLTGLEPFILAAIGPDSDLEATYFDSFPLPSLCSFLISLLLSLLLGGEFQHHHEQYECVVRKGGMEKVGLQTAPFPNYADRREGGINLTTQLCQTLGGRQGGRVNLDGPTIS